MNNATEIRVPTLGETVSEATVGTWFKKVGDTVKADEPLLELETDKVTIEVPAPAAGTLSEIVAKAGETVGLGALLGQIARRCRRAAAAAASRSRRKRLPSRRRRRCRRSRLPLAGAPRVAIRHAAGAGRCQDAGREQPRRPIRSKARGKRGQVLKEDVLAAVAKGAPSHRPQLRAAPARRPARRRRRGRAREERVKMTRLRQTIAAASRTPRTPPPC